MLDLRYNAEAKFYQAPIHFKANGGVFLIDDFGRQLSVPRNCSIAGSCRSKTVTTS